jgi:hypothetical protein
VLSGHTFTQLVRMKAFYFLLLFSVVIFLVGFAVPSVTPEAELKLIKDTAFGVMKLFGVPFGIVGMALLLPKDIEERTLYTILTKPVRRYEYLLGKYFGVLLVLLISMVIMDLMASAVLQVRYHINREVQLEEIQSVIEHSKKPLTPEGIEQMKMDAVAQLDEQGLRMDLHLAVLAIFFQTAVITAVTMAISTFAGSTIFTMLASLCIFGIGHLQADAREYMLHPELTHEQLHDRARGAEVKVEPPSALMRIVSGGIAVLFPDFQAYNVVDAVIAGKDLNAPQVWKMLGLTALYLCIYLGAAIFLFAEKEL